MIEWVMLGFVVFAIASYILGGLKVIKQYERGVKFSLGKYSGTLNPGLNFVAPIFQSMELVDKRQRVIDLPEQEVMTKDQVNLKIDGVVFYSVSNPAQAVINVENIRSQLSAKATSELKEILGNKSMKESLSDRQDIAVKLKEQLQVAIKDQQSEQGKDTSWGIEVRGVQINNINLPQELTRAMAKAAEAVQEKEARLTKAEGELQASRKLMEAAQMLGANPSAMRLRELQTYQEIGSEHNTLMMVIPSGMLSTDMAAMATAVASSEARHISREPIKRVIRQQK
jgi:regulator of protease activity HflC (stomatin/prohibitin superfamily)